MGIFSAIIVVLACIFIGAGVLTLFGILLNLGYYKRCEPKPVDDDVEDKVRWYESAHWG